MHAIIISGSPAACSVAERLLEERHGLSIIERDPRRADELALRFPDALIVCGTGTDSTSLAHARAADSDVIFALAEDDTVNIVACLLAERMYGINTRFALSTCQESRMAFDALDIECICEPETVASALLSRVPEYQSR